MVVFGVVTPCCFVRFINVSEERIASIFRFHPEVKPCGLLIALMTEAV
jgi:hypothetical protein